jgi:hypothetical protein
MDPGVDGIPFDVTAKVAAELVPHILPAVTLILPDEPPTVVLIDVVP